MSIENNKNKNNAEQSVQKMLKGQDEEKDEGAVNAFTVKLFQFRNDVDFSTKSDLAKYYIRGMTPTKVRIELLDEHTFVKTCCIFGLLNYFNPLSNAAKMNKICDEKFFGGKNMNDFINSGTVRTNESKGKYSISQVCSAFPDVSYILTIENDFSFRSNHCPGLHSDLNSQSFKLVDNDFILLVCLLDQLMLIDLVEKMKFNANIMKKVFFGDKPEIVDDFAFSEKYIFYSASWISLNNDIVREHSSRLRRIGFSSSRLNRTIKSATSLVSNVTSNSNVDSVTSSEL